MDMEQMIDDFITFFIAGQETEAISVSFCLMELSRNIKVFKKVQSEIDSVIGGRREITLVDTKKLVYTGHAFSESLRLWPPITSVNRFVDEDIIINGIKIPKNTDISFSIYSAGRSERYYEEPLVYKPERFSENKNNFNCSYFPFSIGQRACMGKSFAQIQAKVFLAKIIQNFDIELDPSQSFEAVFSGNLKPKDGVMCRVKLRKN